MAVTVISSRRRDNRFAALVDRENPLKQHLEDGEHGDGEPQCYEEEVLSRKEAITYKGVPKKKKNTRGCFFSK